MAGWGRALGCQLATDRQRLAAAMAGWLGVAGRTFRAWRLTRPFWGGLLIICGACEILASEHGPLQLAIHIGAQGLAGYLVPLMLLLCGILLWFNPAQRAFNSLLAMVLAPVSWVTSNLGGFFLGMLLGLVGGALAFAWGAGSGNQRPRRPRTDRQTWHSQELVVTMRARPALPASAPAVLASAVDLRQTGAQRQRPRPGGRDGNDAVTAPIYGSPRKTRRGACDDGVTGDDQTGGWPVLRACTAQTLIDAPAEAIWAIVSDVTRVGEWSGECRGCMWASAERAAVPGARFRGANRRSWLQWTRLNEIVTADRPRLLVWRTIPSGPYPDSVEWRLDLLPEGDGTRVRESFTILRMPRLMEWLIWVAMPAHRDRTGDLHSDLGRLKSLVDSTRVAGQPFAG